MTHEPGPIGLDFMSPLSPAEITSALRAATDPRGPSAVRVLEIRAYPPFAPALAPRGLPRGALSLREVRDGAFRFRYQAGRVGCDIVGTVVSSAEGSRVTISTRPPRWSILGGLMATGPFGWVAWWTGQAAFLAFGVALLAVVAATIVMAWRGALQCAEQIAAVARGGKG